MAEEPSMQQLLAELERVKSRLSMYEGKQESIKKSQEDREKKRALKVFKAFDKDASGDIDSSEFQDLVFSLGETLTKKEVNDIVKRLDTDSSGTISFQEFFNWWNSEDHQKLRGSQSLPGKQAALLKAKLTSKAYMKTVLNLVDALKRAEDAKLASIADKDKVSSSMSVTFGKFDESDAGAQFDFKRDPEFVKQLKEKTKAKGEILVGVTLIAKEGIDQFELGEFVGRINFALGAASGAGKKGKSMFTVLRPAVSKHDDQLGVTIYVSAGKDLHKEIPKAIDFFDLLQVQSINVGVEVNKRPSPDAKITDDPLAIKITAKAQADRTSLLTVAKKGIKRKDDRQMLELTTKLLSSELDAEFDDTDFVLEYFPKDFKDLIRTGGVESKGSDDDEKKPLPKLNWGIARALLVPLWGVTLAESKGKRDAEMINLGYEIYSKAVNTLESIHSITVAVGDNLVEGKFKNFDVFTVLPTSEEIDVLVKKLSKDDEDDGDYSF